MNDFNPVRWIANMIALHDIASDACPGVKNVWSFIKNKYAAEFIFFEFTKQYSSVTDKTDQSFFGIGVAVRKQFAESRRVK